MNAYTRICAGSLCLMLLLIFAEVAQAHRVNIFAWLEGETVRVECSFRRDSPVQQGKIIVFDAQTDTELLQGRTDKKGTFVFPVPAAVRQGHGLRIRILAGEGHQNEWHMDAAEFSSLLPAGTAPISSAEEGAGSLPAKLVSDAGNGSAAPAVVTGALSRKDVEAIVDAAFGTLASCPCRRQRSGAKLARHRGRAGLDHGPGGYRAVLFPASALA